MPDPGGRASVTGTDALLRLATGVPSDRIVTDPAVLIDRSHDWSPPKTTDNYARLAAYRLHGCA